MTGPSDYNVSEFTARQGMSRRSVLKRAAFLAMMLPASGAVLAACSSEGPKAKASAGALEKWRMGMPELTADSVFKTFGVDKGFYKDFGIAAEATPIASGQTQFRGVLSGDLEMASSGASVLFSGVASGGAVVSTGALFAALPHVLFVHKDIEKLEDLAGKNVGGGQPGALLQLVAQILLDQEGVPRDAVQYVNVGGSSDVYQAVVAGKVAAGVANPEYALMLAKDPSIPVKVLFAVKERIPNYLRNLEFVSTRLADSNTDLVVRATAAFIKGARYTLDNKDEAIGWMMDKTGTDKETAEAVFDDYKDNNLVNLDLKVSSKLIEDSQKLNVEAGAATKVVPAKQFYRPEIAEQALALLD